MASGDELSFKRTGDFYGILLSDGQIACGEHICQSLSTFAKYAASELNLKWSRQNGWRLVYCHNRCLYDIRKEYEENTGEARPNDFLDVTDDDTIRTTITPTSNKPLGVRSCRRASNCYEEEDDMMFEAESMEEEPSEDRSVPQSLQETIQLATNYNWLKYELQHALEYIHGAPIFDDSRPPFDPEYNSLVSVDFPIDIRDKDFFPVTSEEGAKCC